MNDDFMIVMCGPSSAACKCECGRGGPCEHKWDGEFIRTEGGGTATCSRCGMDAMSHSMWTGD